MENKGIEQGIERGIEQGIEQGILQQKADNIRQLAEYFMKQDSNLSEEDALELAKGILK